LAIALKEAFEGFLNSAAPNQAAKLLARYVDVLLRGDIGNTAMVPSQVSVSQMSQTFDFTPSERAEGNRDLEVHIRQALQIFRYLAAKDAFEAFFKKDLARRLLLQRSCREMEHFAATLLREECGGAYTAGIEGMFQDMEISKALAEVFESKPEAKEILEDAGFDFQISVLTTGRWPSPPSSPELRLPAALQQLATTFASFYLQQHRGRSLRWCPAWGQCLLRANYCGGRKELVVSHFQALVLLCFNTSDHLSYDQLQERTQIPSAELQLTLQSLSLHKTVKFLLKGSKEREVQAGENFSYIASFSHKLYRITVSQISPKEQLQEEDAVEQRVVGSRVHELDAVVIRIMKIKKKMTHHELISEVLMTLRFPAEASDIKRRIESLIERECLERQPPNEQGVTCYTYLA